MRGVIAAVAVLVAVGVSLSRWYFFTFVNLLVRDHYFEKIQWRATKIAVHWKNERSVFMYEFHEEYL